MINTGSFPQFLEKAVNDRLKQALEMLQKEAVWKKFVTVKSATKMTERQTDYENMASLGMIPENAKHPELEYGEGFSQSWTQHMWGGKVSITKMMQHFSQVEIVAELLSQLKLATYKAREILFHCYLEYGDTALASVPKSAGLPLINSLGGDGKTLFFDTHPWRTGGTTWSNLSTATWDIDEAGVANLYASIRRRVDNTGAPLNLKIKDLIFPAELRAKYDRLMLSEKAPASNNNAINWGKRVVGGSGIESQWLSDTADWYALLDTSVGQLECREAWGDRIRKEVLDVDTEAIGVLIDFCIAHGALSLHSIYKCK